MKFAKEFKDALAREGFPPRWVDSAIPYGLLKKSLKKIATELAQCGLDPAALAKLREISSTGPAYLYDFKGSKFRPTLILRLEQGVTVDARLSADTRRYLEDLVNHHRDLSDVSLSDPAGDEGGQIVLTDPSSEIEVERPLVREVEVPLTFDAEFFGLLQGDVENLDALQDEEQRALVAEAGIFFSDLEKDHGKRDSVAALKRLQWFQSEVVKRGILDTFKLSPSRKALNQFISINVTLLRNLQFQEINQKAIAKILKKFDKRTTLGARQTFPRLIQSDVIMTESMARCVCAQVTQDLVQIVPQLSDYTCPVCLAIVWRPIRMECNHVLCVRCTVFMQRRGTKACPLCRDEVILKVD
ncbi:hypothetical protein BOTNAR_0022g00450 [Botryotinia narcissicola]|uniref:RING-14 protein n=1 Tax=Botryotinia narcissicola TaxID=278944 RepID=A0A4Z1J4X0_9HELO|nr:hypothetical protein BOTNAR_0022g00450 [Botryotinia narcissicola]